MNNKLKLEKEFYTTNEIMELLQLSRTTIYRYINSWKLQTYKFWKDHRIKKKDFEDFLEKHKN